MSHLLQMRADCAKHIPRDNIPPSHFHFTDEKTEVKRLHYLHRVTQLARGRPHGEVNLQMLINANMIILNA